MKPRYPFFSHPWAFFWIFLFVNTLLSYFPLSIEAKLWIGLLGLGIPLALWLMACRSLPGKGKSPIEKEFLPPVPAWAWVLLGALALGARFTCLTSLFVWPNFDESSYGFDAYQLSSGVTAPRFFYGVSQAPPFFIWGLALLFKVFGVSLKTVWLFPALVSLSVVPLAYLAARSFFPKSFSFLCALLAAGSFWPVFVGRFSLMTILILPMECLALFFLGKFLKAGNNQARKNAAWGLGIVWGLGFYTHLHWPIVVALTAIPAMAWLWDRMNKPEAWAIAGRAIGTMLGLAFPLFLAAALGHYGGYLSHLWAFHQNFSWSHQLDIWLSCLTSPFWGMDPNVHTYEPQWGGFLNPILASLFFLGALEIFQNWTQAFYRWLVVGFILCLLPGLLTQDMETFRLFPIVPILIVGALVGLTVLLRNSKPGKSLVLVLLLFIPSMVLDSIHLFGFYHHIWDAPSAWGYYTKSVGRYRAFGILEQDWKSKGSGLIFQDFVQGLPDQSLSVATYDFNAALNPRLSPSEANWAAVLANANYQPFLKSRFPDGTAYALSKDLPGLDGGWMLFVFPLDEKRRMELKPWCQAQKALESFEDVNLCYVMGQSFDRDLESLGSVEPFFRGDPFLRAAFFEKQADLETKQLLVPGYKILLPPADFSPAIGSLEKAITQGYPAAHLYFHLGDLYMMASKPAEARKSFQKALLAPLNLTHSAEYLSYLDNAKHGDKTP